MDLKLVVVYADLLQGKYTKILYSNLLLILLSSSWGSKEEAKTKEELEEIKKEKEKMKKEGKKWTRKPNPLFPNITYAGHRRFLPLTHFLRSIGQSQQCCPVDYYNNKLDKVRESYFDEETINKNPQPTPKRLIDVKEINRLNKCCGTQEITFNSEFIYYNGKEVADLIASLYFHHMDFRAVVEYQRISNNTYIEDGKKAIQANKLRKEKKARKRKHENVVEHNTLSIKEDTDNHVNGVKGVWPFASLLYCDICENICYDPFHVFKNIIAYYLAFLLGKRTISDRVKNFCYKTLSHPKGAIWEIGDSNSTNIEKKYLKSVVLSKGDLIQKINLFIY